MKNLQLNIEQRTRGRDTGGQGDDTLDGCTGNDVVKFTGSYADYRITKIATGGQTTYRITDTKTGRDGTNDNQWRVAA